MIGFAYSVHFISSNMWPSVSFQGVGEEGWGVIAKRYRVSLGRGLIKCSGIRVVMPAPSCDILKATEMYIIFSV